MSKPKSVLEKRWRIMKAGVYSTWILCGNELIFSVADEENKTTIAAHLVRLHNANLKKGKTK